MSVATLALLSLLTALPPSPDEPPLPDESGPAVDVVRARIAEVRARLDQRNKEPGAVADLYELQELSRESGALERVADAFVRTSWNPRAHVEVRALAAFLLADVERRRGRLPRADSIVEGLGLIRQAAVIGPFDNENKGGLDVAYGPERDLDLSHAHDGLRGEVRWRVPPKLGEQGVLRLYETITPNRDVVVYALVVLEAKEERVAQLQLGASGALKVWLNGRNVLVDPAWREARFGQVSVPITLKKGDNPLLVKLASGSEGQLLLAVRVSEPDGDPVRGLTVRAPVSGSFATPQPSPARPPPPVRPLLAELERLATGPGATPRAKLDLARLLAGRRPFDASERRHARAAADAAAAAPGDVDAQLFAAATETEDGNRARAFLEAAVAAERPGEARAHAALARHLDVHGQSRRALALLEARLADTPRDWPALLEHARLLDAVGQSGVARRELEGLVSRFPNEPMLRRELATWLRRDGAGEAALAQLRVAVSLWPTNEEAHTALASLLSDRGAVSDAADVLAELQRAQPEDTRLMLRRAELLAANGRLDEARGLMEAAKAIAPQDGELLERIGRLWLSAGDREAARGALKGSLALRPQDARTRELLRALEPGAASFARPLLADLEAEIAAAGEAGKGEDALSLVELTAIRVLPSGQTSRTTQTIRKVLTQRGVEAARFGIRYAPEREEVVIERARVRKPDGTIVETHREDDDSLHEPWVGLWYDARARTLSFPGLAPGDVLELVYRVDDVARDNLLSDYFGDLALVEDLVAKRRWEYVVEMPNGRPLYAAELPGVTHETTPREGGAVLHRFTARDVPRVRPEPGMPGWSEVARSLHVSTYRDWDAVARFWWGLVQEPVAPTPAIRELAKELVAGIPEKDVGARVRAVYGYVVRNTRYVGLEFGIHSFKPYKVEQILRRRFGDCKDKASLMYALLTSVGIESHLVLLRMRDLGRVGPAPASLAIFNHAILYVPSLDLYLDGTAEWSGSGELPEVDHGAEVLVVRPGRTSELAVTPDALAARSVTDSKYDVALAADGSAKVIGTSRLSGIGASGYRRAYASKEGRTALFEQAWGRTFGGVSVKRLDVSDPTKIEEDVQLGWEMEVPRFSSVGAGGALQLNPFGATSSYVESYAPLSTREHPLVVPYPWTNRFRYVITPPRGFVADALPPVVTEVQPFGRVQVAWRAEGATIVVEGELALTAPRVDVKDYAAFRAFLGRVDAAMARKVPLRPAAATR